MIDRIGFSIPAAANGVWVRKQVSPYRNLCCFQKKPTLASYKESTHVGLTILNDQFSLERSIEQVCAGAIS
jgi:hypothetical protein